MRIGILTGGGDVPGLNPCIKAVVYRAVQEGHEVLGIRRGWAGLLEYDPDDPPDGWFLQLDAKGPNDRPHRRHLPATAGQIPRVRPKGVPPEFDRIDSDGPFDCTAHILRVIESSGSTS